MRIVIILCASLIIGVLAKFSISSQLWKGNCLDRIRLSLFSNSIGIDLTNNLEEFTKHLHSIKTNIDPTNPRNLEQSNRQISAVLQKHNLLFEFMLKNLSSREELLEQNFSEKIIERHVFFVESIKQKHNQLNKLVQELSTIKNPLDWKKNIEELYELISHSKQTVKPPISFKPQDNAQSKPALSMSDFQTRLQLNSIQSPQNIDEYLSVVTNPREKKQYPVSLLNNKVAVERAYAVFSAANSLRFKPVYGAQSNVNLNSLDHRIQAANAYDISNLLVTNLRLVNIPARYVYGTIKVSGATLVNWFKGSNSLQNALSILRNSGIPYQIINENGTSAVILMEHIWVEAWLEDSKGKSRWIALDASFNPYSPVIKPSWSTTNTGLNHFAYARKLADQFLAGVNHAPGVLHSVDKQFLLPFLKEVEKTDYHQFDYFLEQYDQGISDPDNYHNSQNEETYLEQLPESLPYDVVGIAFKSAKLPDALRRSFQIQIIDSTQGSENIIFNYNTFVDQLNNHNVKLTFQPASQDDRNVLDFYLDQILNPGFGIQNNRSNTIPAYLIQLKPVLMIDGRIVKTGQPVSLGQSFALNYLKQNRFGKINRTQDSLIAGESVAMNMHAGHMGSMSMVIDVLNKGPYQMLINTAAGISNYHNFIDLDYIDLDQPVVINYPGFSTASTELLPKHWFGQIAHVNFGGIRVNSEQAETTAVYGNNKNNDRIIDSINTIDSMLGGQILEVMLTNPSESGIGISVSKVFSEALNQNIAIRLFDSKNQSLLENLTFDHELIHVLKRLIKAGNSVLIPAREIQIGDWYGIGFVVTNPATGNSRFIVQNHNSVFKREQTAYLVNEITRTLSAIELSQNQRSAITLPETHIQIDQCSNNLALNQQVAKLYIESIHLLNQSKTAKKAKFEQFQPTITSLFLNHISLIDNQSNKKKQNEWVTSYPVFKGINALITKAKAMFSY